MPRPFPHLQYVFSSLHSECNENGITATIPAPCLVIKESLIDGSGIPSYPSFGNPKPSYAWYHGTLLANGTTNIVELQFNSIDGTAMCQLVDLPALIRSCVPVLVFPSAEREAELDIPSYSLRRPRNHHNLF